MKLGVTSDCVDMSLQCFFLFTELGRTWAANVYLHWQLLASGDIESNPGPGELYVAGCVCFDVVLYHVQFMH
jgi:hypothetical protein